MKRSFRGTSAALALALLLPMFGACGSTSGGQPDAAPPDAPDVDAPPPIDAGPDAPPVDAPMATGPVRELEAGGGRVTGGGFVLDVQLGHPFEQRRTTGGGRVLEGGAAVKP